MRTLVNLPEHDVASLDALARRNRRSRAAEVRDAVHRYLAEQGPADWIRAGAGYWRERDDISDGVEYQRAVREDRTSDRLP